MKKNSLIGNQTRVHKIHSQALIHWATELLILLILKLISISCRRPWTSIGRHMYSLVMAPFKQTKQTTFRSRTKTGEKIPEACLLWAAWCHCRDNQPLFSFPAAFFWKAWKLFLRLLLRKLSTKVVKWNESESRRKKSGMILEVEEWSVKEFFRLQMTRRGWHTGVYCTQLL